MNVKLVGLINSLVICLYTYGCYKLGQEFISPKIELKDLDSRLISNIISK
jgi:hypothetical protein